MDTQYLRGAGVGEVITLSGLGAIPGVVTNMRVRGNFEVEKKRMEGTSGSANLPKGFRDAAVEISLELLPPNLEGQIKSLEAAFKQGGVNTARPLRIVNKHLDARGITSVLFVGLDTEEGSEWDSVSATLSFTEYEQMNVTAETRASTPVVSGPAANLNADMGGGGGGASAAGQPPSIAESFASGAGKGAADAKPSETPPYAADLINRGPDRLPGVGSSGGR